MAIINIIILLGIIQGFFLGISLLTIKRGNQKANRVLSILMILIALHLINSIFFSTGYFKKIPQLLVVGRPYVFLFGPIFYIYVKILTAKNLILDKKDFLHFLPFLFHVIYIVPFFVLNNEDKIALFEEWCSEPTVDEYVITFIQIIHVFIYMFFVNHLRNEHKQKIKNSFSSIEQINLDWIRSIFIMFMVVFIVFAVLVIYSALGNKEISHALGSNIIAILASICIYSMGYLGLRQPEIFSGIDDSAESKIKYEKSALTPEDSEKYLKKLIEYMKSEKPFIESNLTILDLANQTSIPNYYLSQIINEKLNQNFYDFINSFRIEEAKLRLLAPEYENLTIIAIAYDVGFNSKSAFNTAFKKLTNLTPSQFRQQIAAA